MAIVDGWQVVVSILERANLDIFERVTLSEWSLVSNVCGWFHALIITRGAYAELPVTRRKKTIRVCFFETQLDGLDNLMKPIYFNF
jgi:hypothetical protein